MTKYVSEYGQRWDVRVPRGAISWLIGRVHVGTSDEEIAADIRGRIRDPHYTKGLIEQSVRYALVCHERNRDLYARVVKGWRFGGASERVG